MAAEPGPGPGPGPDAELEELLESALDDFERSRPAPPAPASSSCPPSPPSAADSAKERFFQELFEGELAAQAAAEFQEAMQELARQEPQLVEQFQKLSEAAGKVGSDAASQQEFTSCLKETLSGLAKNANDLQNSPGSEEELAKALEGLGLDEGGGDGVLPVMRSIMESLLSKDVLYPSLKEITEKVGPQKPQKPGGHPKKPGGSPRNFLGCGKLRGVMGTHPEWLWQHEGSLSPEQFGALRGWDWLGFGGSMGDLGVPAVTPLSPHCPLGVPSIRVAAAARGVPVPRAAGAIWGAEWAGIWGSHRGFGGSLGDLRVPTVTPLSPHCPLNVPSIRVAAAAQGVPVPSTVQG
ncbi:peroxisomal biogenesis factor 19 isoform X2 [Zonotrichia albicollis]|uniref:peroxisomal biogenesis factor 19 isoform X2 n=1 Tax=Zonotrichia albicollis TaxID=44394 RepID=UPI003D80EDD6